MPKHKIYQVFLDEQTHVADSTLRNMTDVLRQFPTPEKINTAWLRKRQKQVAPATVRRDKSLAVRFLQWWADTDLSKADEIQERLIAIRKAKTPKLPDSVTIEDLYTKDELEAIFKATKHTRNRALIEVLYESAVRASELLSMSFKRVRFEEDSNGNVTALVTVKGKTGTREIPLFRSVPALKSWLNVHPVGTGPIWTTMPRRGDKFAGLKYDGLYSLVRQMLDNAGVRENKKRLIHMFRHTRATELVRLGVRGQSLSKFMGWTKKSNMEAVYVHLSTEDVNNELRSKVFGLDMEEYKPEPLIISKKCPKCGKHNDGTATICEDCDMPLSNDAIVQYITESQKKDLRIDALEKAVVMLCEQAGIDLSLFGLALPPYEPMSE